MLCLTLVSCGSAERQVYTMEDKDRPEWATEAQPNKIEANKVSFVGVFKTRKTASTNMNAVMKASKVQAMSQVASLVRSSFNEDTGLSMEGISEPSDIESFSRLVSQATLKNLRTTGRWYEVVEEEINDEDVKSIRYFTKVEISKAKLRAAMLEQSKK